MGPIGRKGERGSGLRKNLGEEVWTGRKERKEGEGLRKEFRGRSWDW